MSDRLAEPETFASLPLPFPPKTVTPTMSAAATTTAISVHSHHFGPPFFLFDDFARAFRLASVLAA